MKKTLITEKGEEDYKYLFNKKQKAIQSLIEDRIMKETLMYKLDYFNNEEANQLYRLQYQ